MLPRILSMTAALIMVSLPAHALDVAGHVLTKMGDPIPGAKVCVKSDPSKCVTTGVQGEFHIATGIGVRKSAPQSAPYVMDYQRGTLTLEAPAAVKARLEWIGPDGRTLFAAKDLSFSRGRNIIALPSGLPDNGVCFIRLRAPELTLTWKAMLMGSRAAGSALSAGATSGRIIALSKSAAAGTLEISKAGYRTRTYEPLSDTETDAVVFLSTPDDVGLTFAGDFSAKVISINRTAKTLIVESVDAECEEATLIKDTTLDTSRYEFRDGKLWLWSLRECTAQVFTGTGTDIVGTWTLSDPAAELPADLRSGCDTGSSSSDIPSENFTAVYAVSETAIKGNVSIEFCPADLYGPLIAFIFFKDTTVSLAKNTCKAVQFKNGKNELANLDFTKNGDSLQVEFKFKSVICKLNQDLSLSDKDPVCPEDGGMDPFIACVAGSGFAEAEVILKKSSASLPPPMSMERKSGSGASSALPRYWNKSVPAQMKQGRSSVRESIFPKHGWRFR